MVDSTSTISVTGLDHVVLRVRDLDAAHDLFGRLGFSLTPRGFHVGRGSANHTAPFRSGTYIELIQLPEGDASTPFGGRLEGPVAVALRPADSRQVHRELADLGFAVEEPRDLARPVDLPEGPRDARFINVSLPDVGPPGLRLFACQHLTRDLVWRADWLDHRNATRGVARVILVDPEPQAFADAYAHLFGRDALGLDGDGLVATIGQEAIAILTPDAFARQFPGIRGPDVTSSRFVGVTFTVASVARTADTLRTSGIPFVVLPDDRVVLGPAEAAGALIEFVGRRATA